MPISDEKLATPDFQPQEQLSGVKQKNNYSSTDITKIIRLQQIFKASRSRKRTKVKTAIDLGKQHAIDIRAQSRANIKGIKSRLMQGELLPPSEQKQLSQEQKQGHYLTSAEAVLFETLLNKEYVLQHTTSDKGLREILAEDKALLDTKEISRRGKIAVRAATPEFGGIEHNIFFGIGSKKSSLPLFVRQRKNRETGEVEDYSTVQVHLTKLRQFYPQAVKNLWCSGHFAHYETAMYAQKMLPVNIGGTVFYWSYATENPLRLDQSTPVKYLNFKRNDGFHIKQRVDLRDLSHPHEYLPLSC